MANTFYHPHGKEKSKKKVSHVLDTIIYPLAFISPIMTIPQLTDVWVEKSVSGVSLPTWAAYATVSAVWFIYGTSHKEKPIIISSISLFILQSSIVIGVLLNR